jgi:hypothetical protein
MLFGAYFSCHELCCALGDTRPQFREEKALLVQTLERMTAPDSPVKGMETEAKAQDSTQSVDTTVLEEATKAAPPEPLQEGEDPDPRSTDQATKLK